LTEPRSLLIDGEEAHLRGGVGLVRGLEARLKGRQHGPGTKWDWSLRNPSREPVVVDRVGLRFSRSPERFLEQGWQSWSPVRPCLPGNVRPRRRRAPLWIRRMLFAEGEASGQSVRGDQFMVTDTGLVGFLGGHRHLASVEARAHPAGEMTAWALLDGVSIAPGQELALEPLWLADGDPGPLYGTYASLWAASAGARSSTPTETGWCSWYQYFGDANSALIDQNLSLAAERGWHVLQIDQGYQAELGRWLTVSSRWDPMAKSARRIQRAGLRPGIWTAPFMVAEAGQVAREHPEWLLRLANGHPVRAHQFSYGWALALDTTHPGVLEHLRAVAAELAAFGFSYHKVDFCYAAALAGRRHDPTATRAEALVRGLRAVREGIGPNGFLLGCGCPLGPAVGLVDALRVSPDTGPHWASRPEQVAPGFDEAAPRLSNALRTSILRAPLHRRLWINDPDCLLLRSSQTELSAWQRQLATDVVSGTGGLLMLSDDLARYGSEDWAQVRRIQRLQTLADTSLESEDPFSSRLEIRSAATTLEAEICSAPVRGSWSLTQLERPATG
jgi:alpha-galactosidase